MPSHNVPRSRSGPSSDPSRSDVAMSDLTRPELNLADLTRRLDASC
jgi:hypothetical protein